MPKCDFCEKELLFPFTCHYCGKKFCEEHRLPENHKCGKMPQEPLFWYQKRKMSEQEALRKIRYGVICPKCGSADIGALGFDEQEINYVCNICNHSWIIPRKRKFRVEELEKYETQIQEKKNNKSKWLILVFCLILLLILMILYFLT